MLMTKIKTMKDWNEEHTQRVPFVPRTHTKAVFDDDGNTLDSLMAVQDEKLSELGSEVDDLEYQARNMLTYENVSEVLGNVYKSVAVTSIASKNILADGSIRENGNSYVTEHIDVTIFKEVKITSKAIYGYLLYAFYNEEGKVIESMASQPTADGTEIVDKEVDIPPTAKTLRVSNVSSIESLQFLPKNVRLKEKVVGFEELKDDVVNNIVTRNSISGVIEFPTYKNVAVVSVGSKNIYTDGIIRENGNSYVTEPIDVTSFSKVKITAEAYYGYWLYAFYNEDGGVVGNMVSYNSAEHTIIVDKEVDIPPTAKTLRVSNVSSIDYIQALPIKSKIQDNCVGFNELTDEVVKEIYKTEDLTWNSYQPINVVSGKNINPDGSIRENGNSYVTEPIDVTSFSKVKITAKAIWSYLLYAFYDGNGVVVGKKASENNVTGTTVTDKEVDVPSTAKTLIISNVTNNISLEVQPKATISNVWNNLFINILSSVGINGKNILPSNNIPLFTLVDDDGSDNIGVIKSVCDAEDVKCTFAVVSSRIDGNTSKISDLQSYQADGFHITSHSATHSTFWDNPFDSAKVEKDIIDSLIALKKWDFIDCDYLVTPFGQHNDESKRLARKWCKCLVAATSSYNVGYGDGRFNIQRLFIKKENTLNYYKEIIDECAVNNGWLVFGVHSGISTEFDSTLVQSVINYAKSKGKFVPLNEAFKMRKQIYDLHDLLN